MEEGREGGGKVGCIHVLNKLCHLCVCVRERDGGVGERDPGNKANKSSLVSIVDIKVLYLDVIHHCSLGVCFHHLTSDSLVGSRTFGQLL